MAVNKDFYQSLGISKGATDAEIKIAYRKQALQWHPDKNKSPEAVAKFKEVTEAYEVLSNPQKRQTYDQFGSAAFESGSSGGFGQGQGPFGGFSQQGPFTYSYSTSGGQNPFGDFSDPFEIFEQFFGGGFSGGRRSRRQSYSLTIDFMEAVSGVEKTVEIGGKQTKIKIPPGVDEGTRIRFNDFDLVVSVLPHKTFQREGRDIHIVLEVDFVKATLGTNIDVSTINGMVALKIPSGTQPDTIIRLRDRGVPDSRGGRSGDEYVHIKIKIPTKLSHDQKQLLEKYSDLQDKRSGWF